MLNEEEIMQKILTMSEEERHQILIRSLEESGFYGYDSVIFDGFSED